MEFNFKNIVNWMKYYLNCIEKTISEMDILKLKYRLLSDRDRTKMLKEAGLDENQGRFVSVRKLIKKSKGKLKELLQEVDESSLGKIDISKHFDQAEPVIPETTQESEEKMTWELLDVISELAELDEKNVQKLESPGNVDGLSEDLANEVKALGATKEDL